MPKKAGFMTIALLFAFCTSSFAGPSEDKLLELENQLKELTEYRLRGIANEYATVRTSLFDSVENASVLSTKYESARDKLELSDLFVEITKASNPRSDTLGFKFTDVVMEAAGSTFEIKNNDEAKSRLLNVIGKLIKNPVVDAVIKSNPISSIVGSIVQSVAGFAETSVAGGFLSKATSTTVDAIKQDSIDKFYGELAPYIGVYDTLLDASTQYGLHRDLLTKRDVAVNANVTSFVNELVSGMKLKDPKNDKPYTEQLANIMPAGASAQVSLQ